MLAEDETEAFNFVLFDRAVKRIVGKTATKLIAERIDVLTTLIECYSLLHLHLRRIFNMFCVHRMKAILKIIRVN